jgi:hypothetical protein
MLGLQQHAWRAPALGVASDLSRRYFYRRLVIESLLARRAVDVHTAWIKESKAGQVHRPYQQIVDP